MCEMLSEQSAHGKIIFRKGLFKMSIEDKLLELWQSILGIEVQTNENFFDIGGTSLMVYQVCSKAKDDYNISIKPIDIMMYPTIESLSDILNERGVS